MGLFSWMKKPATAPAEPVTDGPGSGDRPPDPKGSGGRPVAEHPRVKRVSMSLTEAEYTAWRAAAGEQALSTWAREQVQAQLETGPAEPGGSEVQRLRADLGRVGSNLNQLTRGMHQGQLVASDELAEVLGEVSVQLAEVRRALP